MRARSTVVLSILTAGLLLAAVGCGTRSNDRSSAGGQAGGDSQASGANGSDRADGDGGKDANDGARKGGEKRAAKKEGVREESQQMGTTTHVRLVDKTCVQFEPHWTNISLGQSLTWSSELKVQATIHITPGAFEKTEYVVRAGSSVSTGPARKAGTFWIWTEPAACQGVPRGAQGSGPGVTVK